MVIVDLITSASATLDGKERTVQLTVVVMDTVRVKKELEYVMHVIVSWPALWFLFE